MTTARICCC